MPPATPVPRHSGRCYARPEGAQHAAMWGTLLTDDRFVVAARLRDLLPALLEPIAGRPVIDPRLCAAIVDRLTYGGQIINTGTQSYRLAHTRKRAAAANPPGRTQP